MPFQIFKSKGGVVMIIKKCFLVTLFLAFVLTETGFAGKGKVRVEIPHDQISVSQNSQGFAKFTGENIQFPAQPGKPLIPYQMVTILLPPDADTRTVNISIDKKIDLLPGKWQIKPAPFPFTDDERENMIAVTESDNIVDGKDITVYYENALFPSEILQNWRVNRMRKWNLVDIPVALFQYNPVTMQLYQLVECQINIGFKKDKAILIAKGAIDRFNDNIGRVRVKKLAINFDEIAPEYDKLVQKTAQPGYVILTGQELMQYSLELDPESTHGQGSFLYQKASLGYEVYVVNEDTAYRYDPESGELIEINDIPGWGEISLFDTVPGKRTINAQAKRENKAITAKTGVISNSGWLEFRGVTDDLFKDVPEGDTVTYEFRFAENPFDGNSPIEVDSIVVDLEFDPVPEFGYDLDPQWCDRIELDPYSFVFTPKNWHEYQTVELQSFDNDIVHLTNMTGLFHKFSVGSGVINDVLTVKIIEDDKVGAVDHYAESIRNWLIDHYLSLHIEYVLLIGDTDQNGDHGVLSGYSVPTKLLWPYFEAYIQTRHRFSATDSYFAELTDDWDSNNDGYFGTVRFPGSSGDFDVNSPSPYNELFVGRIPYNTSEDDVG
ncbi:MAG: C25 family cysteine peptidase, partial [Patescibacteria group bacterium]|nr:C25 family cysteine peptidase [Patescibacteria group bacterium]